MLFKILLRDKLPKPFNTFKQAGDFEKMIATYNQSESVIFKKSRVS